MVEVSIHAQSRKEEEEVVEVVVSWKEEVVDKVAVKS